METQDFIVFAVIAVAVGYAIWRTIKSLKHKGDCGCGCQSCPHSKNCK